jgi:hypothetical protein
MMVAFTGFRTSALAETVSLFFDPATPQHVFAGGDIRAALEARKVTFEEIRLDLSQTFCAFLRFFAANLMRLKAALRQCHG